MSAFSSWDPVTFTMVTYIVLGILTLIIAVPLLWVILSDSDRRARKEFVVIVCASLIDISYIFVNVFNSIWRLTADPASVPRLQCISKPHIFLSVVEAALIAIMPLAVALDRLIVSVHGVWYYKQSSKYAFGLCAVPVLLSLALGIVNYIRIESGVSGTQPISGYCYTSGLVDPTFQDFFYFFKWGCILASLLVYLAVTYLYKNSINFSMVPADSRTKIRSGYTVLGCITLNCVLLLLAPDVLLRYCPNKSLTLMTFLFSLIMIKLLFNMILIVVFHKELREAYWSMVRKLFKKGPHATNVISVSIVQESRV